MGARLVSPEVTRVRRGTAALAARSIRSACKGRDEGSAIIEFVMVAVLLVFLLFGVLQIAAVFFVRNVVAASAADAAHYAASADVEVSAGAPRASQLIARALSPSVSAGIACTSSLNVDAGSGAQVARVECRGRIRSIFAPIGAFVTVDVVAHSLKEQR